MTSTPQTLTPTMRQALALLRAHGDGLVVAGGATYVAAGAVRVHTQTARALERRGLVRVHGRGWAGDRIELVR